MHAHSFGVRPRMKNVLIIFFAMLLLAGIAIEQTPQATGAAQPPSTPLFPAANLGAHGLKGLGCLSCHPAARPASEPELDQAKSADFGSWSWGAETLPRYGRTFVFGDQRRYVEVPIQSVAVRDGEVYGILVCLSCHDGNVTPPNMLPGQSFEQRVGLLPSVTYTASQTPTLLGSDNYPNDHPVGTQAVIEAAGGLMWTDNAFRVAPGSPYAHFVSSYGRPALVPGRSSNPWGVNSQGQPFVLCITCHNQHAMSVYISTPANPIASDGGGRSYQTFFFVNGPYNPDLDNAGIKTADSAAQFCRQCHFDLSNEAHNSYAVPTNLPNY